MLTHIIDGWPRPNEIQVGDIYWHTMLKVQVEVVEIEQGSPWDIKVLLLKGAQIGGSEFTKGSTYWPDLTYLRMLDFFADIDAGKDEGA